MPYSLRYHPDVARVDVPGLSGTARVRVARALQERLVVGPEQYGKPLRGTLRGLWSLRVGDYRAVYRIEGDEVHVLRIGHRRDAYEDPVALRRKGSSKSDI